MTDVYLIDVKCGEIHDYINFNDDKPGVYFTGDIETILPLYHESDQAI